MEITKPTLLVDKPTCIENIRNMVEKARKSGVTFRPHFKTHQCHEIGKWFRNEGVEKITVSSLTMAEYFAHDGWQDITVAFPVNTLEIATINRLAEKITLNLLVISPGGIKRLAEKLTAPVNVFIEIDLGEHRSGISFNDFETADRILKQIKQSEMVHFAGFLSHGGKSYGLKGKDAIATVHKDTIEKLTKFKTHYKNRYPDLILSPGDTPTCSLMDNFSDFDEIRPGNFVFYDLTQWHIGSCQQEQIGMAMACPVVATYPERNEMVIYGGAIHFSKDQFKDNRYGIIYGYAVEEKLPKWGEIMERVYLKKMSQEHGILGAPKKLIENYQEGDVIKVLPAHSCLTANLADHYLSTEGETFSKMQG